MKLNDLAGNQKGFTIQEIMVAIIVSSLLVSFSFSVFLFAHKLFHSWQRKMELRGLVGTTLQRIALDVLRAREVQELTDTTFILAVGIDRQLVYRFDGARIIRNDVRIATQENVELKLVIAQSADQLRNTADRLRITVIAKHEDLEYSAEAEVSPKQSARYEFVNSAVGL